MPSIELLIANKNYSSWSLRPWLALKVAGVDFEEHLVPFHAPDFAARVGALSPTHKVPVMRHGGLVVWESLAICEYVADRFPDAGLWPEGLDDRARARAVSAEMHAGFSALRTACPMDLRLRAPAAPLLPAVATDVARVLALWADCRATARGGPFLFGKFCVADAMFAPVVTRFVSYSVDVDAPARAYMNAVLALPAMREWEEGARAETGWPPYAPNVARANQGALPG